MTTTFHRPACEFEAVQWKGDNLEEVRAFCGTRDTGDWNIDENKPFVIEVFNEMGTYLLPTQKNEGATGELWDADATKWVPLNTGDWVVPQEEGFVTCTDEWMHLNCMELTPELKALLAEHERPKSFEHEVTEVINRHSKENPSGTPDFILAAFLTGCLDVYNKTVVHRANWRSESVELPALQRLFDTNERAVLGEPELLVAPGALDGNDGKEVPLVIYTDGQRNEVGTAKVHVTPGEMSVTGTITGALPMFEQMISDPNASYSIDMGTTGNPREAAIIPPLNVPNDDVGESPSTGPEGRFERYQKRGLTSNG